MFKTGHISGQEKPRHVYQMFDVFKQAPIGRLRACYNKMRLVFEEGKWFRVFL